MCTYVQPGNWYLTPKVKVKVVKLLHFKPKAHHTSEYVEVLYQDSHGNWRTGLHALDTTYRWVLTNPPVLSK